MGSKVMLLSAGRWSVNGAMGILVVMILLIALINPVQALADKRVGIVFSETTAANFYDEFSYSQLFMSLQHQAMMAGIPFDLLSENELADAAKLSAYQVLIFPLMSHVKLASLSSIESALDTAVLANGVSIITSGDFLTNAENGASLPGDPFSRMRKYLGVEYETSLNRVAATMVSGNTSHPVLQEYQPQEQLHQYDKLWFNNYRSVPGQNASQLLQLQVGANIYNGALATNTGANHIHFASNEVLADSNLVWSGLRWLIFGDTTPIGLKMGRMENIFISRNDMDMSMEVALLPQTEFALYDLLLQWKHDYNFVGSYYINIGNEPAAGLFTDWSVSAPLYTDYMALGNEIGTHSWTHPNSTSRLSAEQLDFEFRQSAEQIELNLGVDILGAAIPGNPESLFVDHELNKNFDYVSGRYSGIGSGFPGAFGYLRPDFDMHYLSLTMYSDFTLVEFQGNSAQQAEQIWQNQYLRQSRHASQPILHWLWHDYAPTVGQANGYTVEMIANTIAFAKAHGSEFATALDVHQRMATFESARLEVSGSNPVVASINSAVGRNNLGKFSLQISSDKVISRVDSWYAYDEDQLFLARDGGLFAIHLGAAQQQLTHISALPMRANLLTVQGDGLELAFSIEGEGVVEVTLNPSLIPTLDVAGTADYTIDGNKLNLNFATFGPHNVSLNSSADNL